jgi:hypothetical protein
MSSKISLSYRSSSPKNTTPHSEKMTPSTFSSGVLAWSGVGDGTAFNASAASVHVAVVVVRNLMQGSDKRLAAR